MLLAVLRDCFISKEGFVKYHKYHKRKPEKRGINIFINTGKKVVSKLQFFGENLIVYVASCYLLLCAGFISMMGVQTNIF